MNETALLKYDNMLQSMKDAGVEVWLSIDVAGVDFPAIYKEEFGAWLDERMVNEYVSWATFLFDRYSSQVTNWFSFHEPDTFCSTVVNTWRYNAPRPNENDTTTMDYQHDHYNCIHNMLRGHARFSRHIKASGLENATLSIISGADWPIPNTESDADIAASDRLMIWQLGSWIEPTVTGDYPPEMRAAAGDRLPQFTNEEKEMLKNSSTYAGVDHYTNQIVEAKDVDNVYCEYNVSSLQDAMTSDICINYYLDCDDERCGPLVNPEGGDKMSYFRRYPEGLGNVLRWMGKRWPGMKLLVAENGVGLDECSNGDVFSSGDVECSVNDDYRVQFLTDYWSEAYKAKVEDGVNLAGIFHWSFLDNLEWGSGYASHFGLVHVDHTTDELKRTVKKSGHWFSDVVKEGGFVVDDDKQRKAK